MATATKSRRKKTDDDGATEGRRMPPLPNVDVPLSAFQLSDILGVSMRTFRSMLSAQDFPRADFKVRGKSRWLASTLDDWGKREKAKAKGEGGDRVIGS